MATVQSSTMESRRQATQAELDAAKSSTDRNRLGQFATPNPLAIEIAQYVKSLLPRSERIRFADPALGTGSFYSAALGVFNAKHIESAVGIELDTEFAHAAHCIWAESGLKVVQGDFTRVITSDSRPNSPSVILANPPYVRHHHLSRADKERLQNLAKALTGVDVNGLAGLYVYFLLLATAWMEDNGIAAWLIPSEFMDVNYGAALKSFLTNRVTLIRAHRFNPDDVQFGDALVSSVVLVFRKAPPPPSHAVEFTFGGSLRKPHAKTSISVDRLRVSRKWTIYPNHAKNDRCVSDNGDGPTFADFFRIQRGIATGCNEFFILNRADARRFEIPARYLRPILPSPRHLKATVIDGDRDGYPIIDRQLCVIDCDLPESALEARHPSFWQYLRTAESLGIREGYLVSKRNPWYRQERRESAPFLCTYMGRGADAKQPFRFILNRSSAIGTNLYLMLYPHRGLAAMLQKHPNRIEAVHELMGRVTGHELRGEGRVYGGGLHKIEPKELGHISAASFVERWPELSEHVIRSKMRCLFET